MYRVWLTTIAISICSLGLGAVSAQVEKKPEEKKILNKTIGEWIKILRADENVKFRRASLIALEYGDAATNVALPAILEAAEKDKDVTVRLEAVRVIGRFGPKVRPALKALLVALQTDKDGSVREAAATAIGSKFVEPAQEYVTFLTAALKDPHEGTRIAVAGTLRNMGETAQPAVPTLLDTAKDPKEHVLARVAAVHVVSRYGKDNPKTLPLLIDLATNAENPVNLRAIALDGLGRSASGAAEVIAAVGKTLDDKNLEVRKASSTAFVSLGVKAKAGWPTIKTHVSDLKEDSGVRNHLIRVTGVLGKSNPEAIPILTTAAVKDDSTENRIAAIQELGELRALAKSAIETLTTIAQQDGRAAVRDAANKAVKNIRGL